MKLKPSGSILLGLALVLTLSISARSDGDRRDDDRKGDHDRDRDRDRECLVSEHHENDKVTPVSVVGVISIPGNPVISADIAWVDSATERYYFADRSNNGVDAIDAENDVFVGRATAGFAGAASSGGGTATSNGPGPNGVLVTPNHHLWAGDGNSTARAFDADPSSATYLQPLVGGVISTAWNNPAIPADTCDGGTASTHYCGRADELAFDPKDHIIMIANNAPLSTAAGHAPIDPYATFINADTFAVLGHISFVGAGGLEQPIWDPEKQRFLVTVPGKLSAAVPPALPVVLTPPAIHVINPLVIPFTTEVRYPLSGNQDCFTITGGATADNSNVGITGIALAPFQHFLVSACGFPVILTLNPSKVTPNLNGTIHVLNVIKQVGGGDEVWFNPGDDRFYVTALATGGTVQQLGVIDAEDSSFLQNVPQIGVIPGVGTRGKNPAAFPEENRIFDIQQINAAIVSGTSPDDSVCAKFNVTKMGCVAVFRHESEAEEAEQAFDEH